MKNGHETHRTVLNVTASHIGASSRQRGYWICSEPVETGQIRNRLQKAFLLLLRDYE